MTERKDIQQAAINAEKERYADMLEQKPELAVVASTSFIAAWELLQNVSSQRSAS